MKLTRDSYGGYAISIENIADYIRNDLHYLDVETIQTLIQAGRPILAIRLLRTLYPGLGLRDAKNIMDSYR